MRRFLTVMVIGVGAAAVATPAMADQGRYGRYADRYDYRGYDRGYVSDTDRDGDGYDDRDTNFNHYIDPWERRATTQYNRSRRGGSSYSATDRNGDGYDDRDRNFNGHIEPWEQGRRRY